MEQKTDAYNEVNIQVLKGLQSVRVRPGMYIGDTGKKGLHHLVWEIIDNSVDEAMGGYCKEILIIIEKDGSLSVEDDGRGIPVAIHPTEKKSALEVVLTVLHAGGKFDGQGYKASGGLHGVGASCVNALSDYLKAEVWREGGYWTQEYSKGDPTTKVKKEKDLTKNDKQHGTKITFHPDASIFKETIKFDENVILKRLHEVAFLNKGLSIEFKNLLTGTEKKIKADGGISDYVKYLTEHRTGLYPSEPIYAEKVTSLTTREGEIQTEVALNYANEDDETILSFANNINTVDGGTHTSGFKTALTRVVNQFARSMNLIKEKDNNLSGDDVREGLTAIISVRFPQPEFVGQTKAKLGTVEIEGIVSSVVTEMLTEYFEKNAAIAKKIIERAIIAQEARDAAKKQSAFIKRKSFFGGANRLPGKLSDCDSNKRENCELFIVEGNSAAGSAKDGRDSQTQAILPIRGKITNAEKNDVADLLGNKEIQSLILAIGTNIKDEFNIENRRYDKVIIMTDADDDGSHIAILLITFFYRYMKQLVTDGHLYLAQPPLFRVDCGKEKVYCYNEQEMQAATIKFGEKAKVVRFKGLGEMNAEELSATTMQKDKRRLLKLVVPDVGDAERLLSILMGSNAQSRKNHITNQVNSVIQQ